VQQRSTPLPAGDAVKEPIEANVSGLRWWRAPIWFLALFTGAKSFVDNPILGSERLNRAGLHVWRLRAAHALARWRRARLAHLVPADLRQQFERDGFVVIRDAVPADDFGRLQTAMLESEFECRSQQQGDTVTRRVAVGPALRRHIPLLDATLRSRSWRGLMAYVASARAAPLYYIQTISGGALQGPPDPQQQLHSDTFHPSLKAWLFLTDVKEGGRPLTYVAGSHRLSKERIDWQRQKSIDVLRNGDRLSQRGSLRVRLDELQQLGLPEPTRFCVPANTLVVVDTCGFHARAVSSDRSVRVELWAYCRRNPFLPWTSGGPISWPPIATRQAEWLQRGLDFLHRHGLRKQHWQAGGRRRPIDP
jgi:hypothetical protein